MTKPIIFHLEGPYYKAILDGVKRIEYRDNTVYWRRRLLPRRKLASFPIWFVAGYPKNNLPRIEAKAIRVVVDIVVNQIEVHFQDPVEKV